MQFLSFLFFFLQLSMLQIDTEDTKYMSNIYIKLCRKENHVKKRSIRIYDVFEVVSQFPRVLIPSFDAFIQKLPCQQTRERNKTRHQLLRGVAKLVRQCKLHSTRMPVLAPPLIDHNRVKMGGLMASRRRVHGWETFSAHLHQVQTETERQETVFSLKVLCACVQFC